MTTVVTWLLIFGLGAVVGWAAGSFVPWDGESPQTMASKASEVFWMETHRKMPPYFIGAGVVLVVTDIVLLLSMLAGPTQDQGVPGAVIATVLHVGSAITLICIGRCVARHAQMDEPPKVIQEPVHR